MVEKTTKLDQLIYFKDVLTSDGNQDICYVGKGILFLFPWMLSQLIKIRFEQEKSPNVA